jgi:hypothetical protein
VCDHVLASEGLCCSRHLPRPTPTASQHTPNRAALSAPDARGLFPPPSGDPSRQRCVERCVTRTPCGWHTAGCSAGAMTTPCSWPLRACRTTGWTRCELTVPAVRRGAARGCILDACAARAAHSFVHAYRPGCATYCVAVFGPQHPGSLVCQVQGHHAQGLGRRHAARAAQNGAHTAHAICCHDCSS